MSILQNLAKASTIFLSYDSAILQGNRDDQNYARGGHCSVKKEGRNIGWAEGREEGRKIRRKGGRDAEKDGGRSHLIIMIYDIINFTIHLFNFCLPLEDKKIYCV